jgi:signal transduction histidine kinase
VNALLKGQNAERRRISQELHDRLGGMLFMAKQYFKQLDNKIREIQKEQAKTYDKFSGLLDEVVDEVRRISHDLYEGSLQKFGYSVALKQLVAAVTESNDLEIRLDLKDFPDSLEVDDQHELYAITQEMLSNTLKHAQATEINIEMQEGENELTFTYSDNGRGFDPETTKNGIGIENIRDRVKKIKGKFNIFSGYDEGTKFIIIIPRRVEDQSEHSR